MTSRSWHVSEQVGRPVDAVYGYAADPANLASWAPGLGHSVERVTGQ